MNALVHAQLTRFAIRDMMDRIKEQLDQPPSMKDKMLLMEAVDLMAIHCLPPDEDDDE